MEKVINGKIYNTETATRIGQWDNGSPISDFDYCDEELYITAKGAYFLACEGGALSIYARATQNGQTRGEAMNLLSERDALNWCETHEIDVETIRKHFQEEEG